MAIIPILFRGEMMTCCMCRVQERSDPKVESGWRVVQIYDDVYYVCPRELPPDGSKAEEYRKAYAKVLRRCLALSVKGAERGCS